MLFFVPPRFVSSSPPPSSSDEESAEDVDEVADPAAGFAAASGVFAGSDDVGVSPAGFGAGAVGSVMDVGAGGGGRRAEGARRVRM